MGYTSNNDAEMQGLQIIYVKVILRRLQTEEMNF